MFYFFMSLPLHGADIHVAVASNFAEPMNVIATEFEANTGDNIIISLGASGKLFAQIENGAPFDIFLSADSEKPAKLIEKKLGIEGSIFTYAIGELALWSADTNLISNENILSDQSISHIAIANPLTAPYGKAAIEVIAYLKLEDSTKGKIVTGENISQAFQFVQTGNAEIGFVALSQIQKSGKITEGSAWIVPESMHQPIKQDAVLIKDSLNARAFLEYLKSDEALKIIKNFGYKIEP